MAAILSAFQFNLTSAMNARLARNSSVAKCKVRMYIIFEYYCVNVRAFLSQPVYVTDSYDKKVINVSGPK